MTAAERDVETTNKEMPRRRSLWVTGTLQWALDARLARPANPMPDSEASAFQFVASCLSNWSLPSPVNATPLQRTCGPQASSPLDVFMRVGGGMRLPDAGRPLLDNPLEGSRGKGQPPSGYTHGVCSSTTSRDGERVIQPLNHLKDQEP
jgi:hypothetical protein